MFNSFKEAFDNLQKRVYDIAVAHGWWEGERNDGELIALMHSELSEGLEGLRHGNPPSDHIPEFSAIEEELADVVIRAMDYAESRKLNLSGAIMAKIDFNAKREFKHGGKKF